MAGALREAVRRRAGSRCEYCHATEDLAGRMRFHVEHITARQHRGDDSLENLAFACPFCNAHKGTNLTGIDPDTGSIAPLFHPRRDSWPEHFVEIEGEIIGRATVVVLKMNDPLAVALRRSTG